MHNFLGDLIQTFLPWKQGDEDEDWRNKAITTLFKRLRKDDQHTILQDVLCKKSERTPCVTIEKSQDGRLQVSHKKMLPHVMYCRIFRWPDLQNQNELQKVPHCRYSALPERDNKPTKGPDKKLICINPYHYIRIDHTTYPPVVTPRNAEFTNATPPPQSPLSPSGQNTYLQQHPGGSPTYFSSQSPGIGGGGPLQLTPQPAHHHSFHTAHTQENPNDPFNYIRNQQQLLLQQQQQQQQHHQQQPQQQSQQQQLGQSNYYQSQSPLSESNSWYSASGNNGIGTSGEAIGGGLAESPRAISQYDSQSPPPGYTTRDPQFAPMDTTDESQQTNTNSQMFQQDDGGQDYWCRITYAELNQKIGESFKGSSPKVIVDGFTDPSVHNRFSLGVLSNINRNSTIEMTRRHIRKGICLENNGAQIYVTNLSESSIFFHSKNCNVDNQLNQHAVVKIEPQRKQKIFDQKVFESLVQEAITQQDNKRYERLYNLIEHCMIKMSFVKGWGSIYQRQDVTSTPCWIEIHLLKPYALIDQYLSQMGPPSSQITSTS